jgi:hypothetical protein
VHLLVYRVGSGNNGSFSDLQGGFLFGVGLAASVLVVECEKMGLLSFEVGVKGVEDEGGWEEFEGVDLVELAVL